MFKDDCGGEVLRTEPCWFVTLSLSSYSLILFYWSESAVQRSLYLPYNFCCFLSLTLSLSFSHSLFPYLLLILGSIFFPQLTWSNSHTSTSSA